MHALLGIFRSFSLFSGCLLALLNLNQFGLGTHLSPGCVAALWAMGLNLSYKKKKLLTFNILRGLTLVKVTI